MPMLHLTRITPPDDSNISARFALWLPTIYPFTLQRHVQGHTVLDIAPQNGSGGTYHVTETMEEIIDQFEQGQWAGSGV